MARSSAVVNAAGPRDQSRSRGRSALARVETGTATPQDSGRRALRWFHYRAGTTEVTPLPPGPVALLVLPPRAAGTGIVPPHLGNSRRGPSNGTVGGGKSRGQRWRSGNPAGGSGEKI